MTRPASSDDYVSVRRLCRILGVDDSTVYRLISMPSPHGGGMLELVSYRKGATKRILYGSVLRFCDRLREQYTIPDRRPQLADPLSRHRDEDLLPFPLADTALAAEACAALGYETYSPLVALVRAGLIVGYQLFPRSPWRFSRCSILRFLEASRGRVTQVHIASQQG